MLNLIGDIHGDFFVLPKLLRTIDKESMVVQVGDFGYWPGLQKRWEAQNIDRPIYFIDGNHDCLPALVGGRVRYPTESGMKEVEFPAINTVTEVWPNLFYIPRGSVMEVAGKQVALMGGAASVDKARRIAGVDWFPEEQIRNQDVDTLIRNLATNGDVTNLKKVDIFVTHTPPDNCVRSNFNPRDLVNYFGLPITWKDPSAVKVEEIAKKIGNPQIVCGHMHRTIRWSNVAILNCNEVMKIE